MRWSVYFVLLLIAVATYGQKVQPISWQQCYGGPNTEAGYEIIETSDQGFLLAGKVQPENATVPNAYVIKLAPDGSVEWEQAFGAEKRDQLFSIIESSDGYYYLAGSTESSIAGHHGAFDAWVIKLKQNGDLVWQACYGGTKEDVAQTIAEDAHGDLLLACMASSIDGDVTGNHGAQDVWMLKIDSDGKLLRQKCYGGSKLDAYYNFGEKGGVTLTPSSDGGFVFSALTVSKDGDLEARKDRGDDLDLWIVKVAEDNSTIWSSVIGGEFNEWPNSIIETLDSGLVIAGIVSTDLLSLDGLVIKLDENGTTEWQRSFGKNRVDEFISIVETDDGYMLAGVTYVDTLGQHFGDEAWIVSIDAEGSLIDEQIFGGSHRDVASDIIRCDNGRYRFIGQTYSEDGDLLGYHKTFETFSDIWVAEFGTTSNGFTTKDLLIAIFPNPTSGIVQTVVQLSAPSQIHYELIDLSGNHIVSSTNIWYEAGKQSLAVDLSAYPTGSYLFRLNVDGVLHTNTIQLVK